MTTASSKPATFGYTEAQEVVEQTDYFCARLDASEGRSSLRETCSDLMTTEQMEEMYWKLVWHDRVAKEFHVTLIDHESKDTYPHMWRDYCKIYLSQLRAIDEVAPSAEFTAYMRPYSVGILRDQGPDPDDPPATIPSLGKVDVKLTHLVWGGRVMVFPVTLSVSRYPSVGFVGLPPHLTVSCYVLVGTSNDAIDSKEAANLLERWSAGGSNFTTYKSCGKPAPGLVGHLGG